MTTNKFPYLEETDEKVAISSYGRTYTYQQTVLPSSILSQGQELLKSPIHISLRANGRDMNFAPAKVFPTDYTEEGCTLVATAESELFYVNTSVTTEEDGCSFVKLTLMPRGYTVRQIYGLEPIEYHPRMVEHMWVEVPIRKDVVQFYHVRPETVLTGDFPETTPKALLNCDFIPEGGLASEFTAQLTLCGEKVGFGMFFTTSEGWHIADSKRAFEVVETEDAYILRIHLLDGSPEAWGKSCEDAQAAVQLRPLSFKFGFVATPMKELPKRPFVERSFHVDCFKKIETDYEKFLSKPVVEGSDEIGFDRLQRLGVKILYIHEKWNDIQNSPILTTRTQRRLRYIVEECHKRGIRVIPYFGFEISSLSPYYGEYGSEMMCVSEPNVETVGSWNRWPAQRALWACQKGPWGEKFVEGVKKIVEDFDLDGLYLDSTANTLPCGNLEHGCGYVHNGNVIPTFSTEGVRRTLKALGRFMEARGGTIMNHGFGSMTLPALYYCTSLWEGETFQNLLMHGELSEMPEGHLRAIYTGSNWGVPVYSLCYSEPPVWTYSNAISMALLHNSMPKPVDIGEPLEETSKIWDIYDAFPIEEAKWYPYFHKHGVSVSTDKVKVSYYETDNEVLAVCSSVSTELVGMVELDFSALNIKQLYNAMTNELLSDKGRCSAEFGGFQYYLLLGKK